MKWFKFLIYFALFAAAIIAVYNGVQLLTGSHYGSQDEKTLVYSVFEIMKTVDLAVGLLYLGSAVYAIVTRFALSGYKSIGPKLLFGQYALNTAINLIYVIAVSSVLNNVSDVINVSSYTSQLTRQAIGQVILAVVMIIVNKVYFDKRKDMFVN